MKVFLPVIRSAQLFSGISVEELTAILSCLRAEKKTSRKKPLCCVLVIRQTRLVLCWQEWF